MKEYIHIQPWIFHRGFELYWFSECGDWFVYLRYKVPLPHMQKIFEIRFSSAGFMKTKYILMNLKRKFYLENEEVKK